MSPPVSIASSVLLQLEPVTLSQRDPLKLQETLKFQFNFKFLRSFLSTLLGTESDVNSNKAQKGSLKSMCCVCATELGQAPGTEGDTGNEEELQKDISAEEQLLSQPSRAEGTACRH